MSAINRRQTMDAAKKACASSSHRTEGTLEDFVNQLPFVSDDTLLLLSLDCYSPEYHSDDSLSSYSLVFSYDRLTPSDRTETTNSSWDASQDESSRGSLRVTPISRQRSSSSPRKQEASTLSLPGRYAPPVDDVKNRGMVHVTSPFPRSVFLMCHV